MARLSASGASDLVDNLRLFGAWVRFAQGRLAQSNI
jgi:hypothetical protein